MSFAFLLTCIPCLASDVDISSLSLEELSALKMEVDQRLLDLGAYYIDIKPGDKGDSILNMQKRLSELNYYSKGATGKADEATVEAWKDFQKAHDFKRSNTLTIEQQELLFSSAALIKVTPTPRPTSTPKVTKTPDPRKAYSSVKYEDIFRYPENFLGAQIKFSGKVVQVLGSRSEGFQVRLATRGSYDNIIFVFVDDDPGFNILEDDRITVYGYFDDLITYESVLGGEITLPSMVSEILELNKK